MDRNTASVDGRYPRWGHNNKTFDVRLFNLVQKRGFSRSGLTRQKNIPIGVQNKVGSEFQFFVYGRWHKAVGMKATNLIVVPLKND